MGSGPSIEVVARELPPPSSRCFTVASVHGFSDVATALDLEKSHRLVAAGQSDGNVKVYGRAGASVALVGGYADPVLAVHFLDMQGRLVAVHPGAVVLWDLDSGKTACVYSIEADIGETISCSFLLRPFGERFLFLGTTQGAVFVFDLLKLRLCAHVIRPTDTLGPAQSPHAPGCVAVAANPAKESYVLIAYEDGRIVCWDLEHGKLKYQYRASGTVRALAWDPAGDSFAVGLYEGVLELWGRREPDAPRSTVVLEKEARDRDPILGVAWGKAASGRLYVAGGSRRLPGVHSITLPPSGAVDPQSAVVVRHITAGFTGRCMGFVPLEKQQQHNDDGDKGEAAASLVALSDDNTLSVCSATAADARMTLLPFPSPVLCMHFTSGPTSVVVRDRLRRQRPPPDAVLQGGIASEFQGRPTTCDGLLVTAHEGGVVRVWWCAQLSAFELLDTLCVRHFIEDEDRAHVEISRIKVRCAHGTAQLLVGLVGGPCVVLEQQNKKMEGDEEEEEEEEQAEQQELDGAEDTADAFVEEHHAENDDKDVQHVEEEAEEEGGGGGQGGEENEEAAGKEEAILAPPVPPRASPRPSPRTSLSLPDKAVGGSSATPSRTPTPSLSTSPRVRSRAGTSTSTSTSAQRRRSGQAASHQTDKGNDDGKEEEKEAEEEEAMWGWALMMMVGHAAAVRTMHYSAAENLLIVGDESGVFTLTDTLRDECVNYQQAAQKGSTIVTAVHVGPMWSGDKQKQKKGKEEEERALSCVYVGLSDGTLRMYGTDGRHMSARPRALERERETKHPQASPAAAAPGKARAVRLIQTFHSSGRMLRCGDAVVRNEEQKSGGCLLIVSGKQLHVTELPAVVDGGAGGPDDDDDSRPLRTVAFQLHPSPIQSAAVVERLHTVAVVDLHAHLTLYMLLDLQRVALDVDLGVVAIPRARLNMATDSCFVDGRTGAVFLLSKNGEVACGTLTQPKGAFTAATVYDPAITARLAHAQLSSAAAARLPRQRKSIFGSLFQAQGKNLLELFDHPMHGGAAESAREELLAGAAERKQPHADSAAKGASAAAAAADEENAVAAASSESQEGVMRMREAVQRMQANVDKAKEVEDKAERLNENASNFYDLSKKLAQQQKKKAGWFP